jgi:hypothetical protein
MSETITPNPDDALTAAELRAEALRARYQYIRALEAAARIAADTRTCATCHKPLKGTRSDAITCSNKCRCTQYRRARKARKEQASARAALKSRSAPTLTHKEKPARICGPKRAYAKPSV